MTTLPESSDGMRRARVFLVEDNPADVELTKLAFEDAGIVCDLEAVGDGADALERLRAMVAADARVPDLILLDLNLPRVDGLALLAFVRGDPAFAGVPAVILTTSGAPQDRERSERSGAARYLVKSSGYGDFVAMVRALVPLLEDSLRRPTV